MGVYLNSKRPYTLYQAEASGEYFVDKTTMLEELFPLIEQGGNYTCITRPRRFGKTITASMIGAFFGKEKDSRELFSQLKIASSEKYKNHINQHNIIYIAFNEAPTGCTSYKQYIDRIQKRLIGDLQREYPDCHADEDTAVWDILNDIYELQSEVRFIFIFDEWDYIFHRDYVTEQDRKSYVEFLSNLLKNQPYVSYVYMTGILPIAKYSSGSELNMFLEYTMASEEKYCEYFGFTEEEVDELFDRYSRLHMGKRSVTREGLRLWYDGYHTYSGGRVYNPRSVVASLSNNNLGNYWTSAGPYDEIFYYIEKNIDEIRDDIVLMVSGIPVSAKIREYAATSMNLTTRDEIFSAMVVYGFLSYENGSVMIPNRELMEKFEDMLKKETSLGYVNRLAKLSEQMLKATLSRDTKTMVEILENAHNTEIPLLSYNNETELTALVNLVYLSARDFYRVEREDRAGKGYVDFIFYPQKNSAETGIILELKIGKSPDDAIRQIKERGYALQFCEKITGETCYAGEILAVGITYDKNTKKHDCKVETL
ncbi:MAG: ATP-binding protein [Roseburia sp.]|nr:ATP-binding protein [Roseburia sp.]MCM1243141.1 ATP-binding protein [Roseburia sp.]